MYARSRVFVKFAGAEFENVLSERVDYADVVYIAHGPFLNWFRNVK